MRPIPRLLVLGVGILGELKSEVVDADEIEDEAER